MTQSQRSPRTSSWEKTRCDTMAPPHTVVKWGDFTRFAGYGFTRRIEVHDPLPRVTNEPGNHVSLGRRRQTAGAAVGDEPAGHAHLGLVSSLDEIDGVGSIRQRAGAV